jgi:hypothetical protein
MTSFNFVTYLLRQNLMLFKTLRKGVLARFMVGAAAMVFANLNKMGNTVIE